MGDGQLPGTNGAEERTATRRRLIRLALATGGAAVVVASRAEPAVAGVDGDVVLGSSSNGAATQTTVVHNNNTQNGAALSGVRTTDTTTGVQFSENCGVLGQSDIDGQPGVLAFGGGGATGKGVEGFAFDGSGVLGHTTNGAAVAGLVDGPGVSGRFEGGRAQLLLVPAATPGPPTANAHSLGELYVDSNGRLLLCKVAGTPGTWSDISGPSLHVVTPTRVYDSRLPQPQQGSLASGQSRTVSVADGRDLNTGAVTMADLVPAGATAVAYNLTVVNTVGQGFLTVNPGGNTTVTSSANNWYGSDQVAAAGSLVGVDASRQVTVIAGGFGSTDFHIDIVGYYA